MHLFEIIGPIMIGPSSSHTAGAARIGRITAELLGEPVRKAIVGLHGSFAKTYKGHGTDRAIAGGLMGMEVDDVQLRDSLQLAAQSGLDILFRPVALRGAHPNTAMISAYGESRSIEVTASSVGGGSILVVAIDGLAVEFTGEENTLIVRHRDVPGAIASVSAALARSGVNIASMRVSRKSAGEEAIMALELDVLPDRATMDALRSAAFIDSVTLLAKR
jgi:L-serine dehydratase